MVKPSFQHDTVVINVPFGGVRIDIQSEYVIGVELFPSPQQTHEVTSQFAEYVAHQMSQYFKQANSRLDISYALAGTPFQKRVWTAISDIPVGEVLTYSELASRVGSEGLPGRSDRSPRGRCQRSQGCCPGGVPYRLEGLMCRAF